MKKLLLAFLLLASCSSSKEGDRQHGKGGDAQSAPQAGGAGNSGSPQAGAISTLVGLYEGGGQPRNQMCVVKGKGGDQRFGLIVWGANQHSCMGSGIITRDGNKLRLAMAGDSACTIEATVSGNTIRLPAAVPQGCAYYCGARASLGGAALTQQGTTGEAAMRARDIVGEPLCAGEGG